MVMALIFDVAVRSWPWIASILSRAGLQVLDWYCMVLQHFCLCLIYVVTTLWSWYESL